MKTIIVNGSPFPASKDSQNEQKLLQKLGALHSDATNAFEKYNLVLPLGGSALKKASRELEGSFAVKFVSSIQANAKLPFKRRSSLVELADVASDLYFHKPYAEPVAVWPRAKSSSGWRPIHNFGIGHRTAQQVARRLLAPHVKPRPWQYDYAGVDEAIAAVATAVVQGRLFMAHIDIKNFYGAFLRKYLREALPVPRKLVDHFLVGEFLNIVPGHSPGVDVNTLKVEARKGAPQGSSVSAPIGVKTISELGWHPTSSTALASYGDNLILMGTTEDGVAADAKALGAAVAALPTGNFEPKLLPVTHAGEGLDFLGVRLSAGKSLEIVPQAKTELKFLHCLRQFQDAAWTKWYDTSIESDPGYVEARCAVGQLWNFANGWLSAFRMCTNISNYQVIADEVVGELLIALGCSSIEELKSYMPGSPVSLDYVSG